MDVVLTPMNSKNDMWSLKDRLGRNLGIIEQGVKADTFRIKPEAGTALQVVKIDHASLGEAMTAIAALMNGACNLDSQQWV